MTEISVHEHYILALAPLESVDVGTSQAQLAWSGVEHDLVRTVDSLKMLYLVLGTIGTVIINDNDLHINLFLLSALHQHIDDQRKVLSFVVGGKDHTDVIFFVNGV
jgi:hypothetical protein